MRRVGKVGQVIGLWVGILGLSACAFALPASRLGDYMGVQAVGGPGAGVTLPQAPIRAGLLLISDTSAPDAAPALPDEALSRLAEGLTEQLRQALPIRIERAVSAQGIRPTGDPAQFSELGRQQGLDYLIVAILSGTEREYPISVFLGWTTHMQPGLRRDNWSLIEVALVEVKSGRVVLQAEGRGWVTLDRPSAPGINQWYPVIWRRPQEPNWRWWPPTYTGAPTTLRIVSMQEAAKRLVLNLQEAWIEQRLAETAPPHG